MVDLLASASSPVSEIIITAIVKMILGIAVIAAIAAVAIAAIEMWFDAREQRMKTVVHDTISGFVHPSVEDMISWKMENHPEEFEKHPYYCPYCGAEFETVEQRDMHMQICPEKPPSPPELPELPKFGFGLLSSLIQLIYYKAVMFRFPWLKRR